MWSSAFERYVLYAAFPEFANDSVAICDAHIANMTDPTPSTHTPIPQQPRLTSTHVRALFDRYLQYALIALVTNDSVTIYNYRIADFLPSTEPAHISTPTHNNATDRDERRLIVKVCALRCIISRF